MSQKLLYAIDQNFTEPMQETLLSMGIDSYWKTGLLFSAVTGAAIHAAKPTMFYSEDGSMKPWNVGMDPTSAKLAKATPVPVWLASLSTGYLLAMFI